MVMYALLYTRVSFCTLTTSAYEMPMLNTLEKQEAVARLFSRYRDIALENTNKLSCMPDKCTAGHLADLCNEAILNCDAYPSTSSVNGSDVCAIFS